MRPSAPVAPRAPRTTGRTQAPSRVPARIGLLVLLAGLVDLVSSLTRADQARLQLLRPFVPGSLRNTSTALTLVIGVLLVVLSRALVRQKRRAWRAAVLLLSASVVLHVLKGLDVEEATGSAGLLVALLWRRKEFQAAGDPRTRWRAVGAFLLLLATSCLLGVLLILLRASGLAHPFRISTALSAVLRGLVGLDNPSLWAASATGQRAADLVGDSTLLLGLVTLGVTAYLVLRPSEPEALLSDADEHEVRALLATHGGRDSLGYFALRQDKSVVWSPDRRACITYRVLSGVVLASGDPVGEPGAWPGAIAALLDLARAHAWSPAVLGCGEEGGAAWRRAGLDVLELGDEAVLDVGTFCLQGREMRNVRQAVARAQRAGVTVEVQQVREIDREQRTSLRQQAEAWRGTDTERGFSMALGRLGLDKDGDCVVANAFVEGRLVGFLHLVPWGSDGLSLDLMRRERSAPSGINELLIAELLAAAPTIGVRRVSLNFAVFRTTFERGERLGAGPVLRATRAVLLLSSRWFQLESLYRFNAKFQPRWQPRYVCYRQARDLPRVVLAAAEAEAFLVWPRLPWSRRR